jgi:uncharacterized membrane protein (DUF485 family)
MNSQPKSGDLTPEVGSQTDIAPLGRSGPKPAHELTAAEDSQQLNWQAVNDDPVFHELLKAKLRFIIPSTIFFFVYYFALPVLVGYCPALMAKKVWGEVNLAYLFALSQFIMAWVLAGIYVRVAAGWDRRATALLSKISNR